MTDSEFYCIQLRYGFVSMRSTPLRSTPTRSTPTRSTLTRSTHTKSTPMINFYKTNFAAVDLVGGHYFQFHEHLGL